MCKIHKFCVTHVNVDVSFPSDTFIVHLGKRIIEHGYKNKLIVSELYDDLDVYHQVLGGSSGSFAINRYLKKYPECFRDDDKINLFQYKKFILRGTFGKPSAVYPGLSDLTFDDLKKIDLNRRLDDNSTEFLIARPLNFKNGLLHQYQAYHPVEDFLRYTGLAVELGVLNSNEVKKFFDTQYFIPCGAEFGVMPIRVFKEIVTQLELICLEFLKYNRPKSLDVYNRRGVSFCGERLGGYLLLKKLLSLSTYDKFFDGVIHNVSVDGKYKAGRD